MEHFIYQTVPKNPERVFPETQKHFFLHWKHQKKTNLALRNFFFKKVFGKKSLIMMLKNAKRDPLGSINVFHKPTLSKKFKGVPFDRIHKFSEKKAHGAEKKTKGTLWSTFYFWKHWETCGLVRDSIPTFFFWKSEASESLNRKKTEKVWTNIKSRPIALNWRKKTSHCESRAFSSKAPTKNHISN